ncbi:MAG: nucleotide sugar dehydrogenase [Candidatus Methanofastidiosia archaeon]
MKDLMSKVNEGKEVVCVVGLGYVGMPLAMSFSKKGVKTIGYHYRQAKIDELNSGIDSTREYKKQEILDALNAGAVEFTASPEDIGKADFVIITVPTPITKSKDPDISHVVDATHTVGKHIKRGTVVVYESTVYPGLTEDICLPILEKESGLRLGRGFYLGYSPERVNPGDKEHTLVRIKKVVSGADKNTCELLFKLYSKIIEAGVFKAKDIKTAEAAKVIENTQRDLNIALMNELAIIFKKMDIDIYDVIEAASTKWNFHRYVPGLVGGHCIPVDPYYLLYKSEQMGYHPQVITAGRKINDEMPLYIFNMIQKEYNERGKVIKNSRVLFMGVTFKENINDLRNTQTKDLIEMFKSYGADVFVFDPNIPKNLVEKRFDVIAFDKLPQDTFDCIIVTVAHKEFLDMDFTRLGNLNPIYVDIRNIAKNLKDRATVLGLGKD